MICLFIVFSAILVISTGGFGDDRDKKGTIERGGVKCKFRAIILNIERHPDGYHILVVTKTPAKKPEEKKIYVIVTEKTVIGHPVHALSLREFKIDDSVLVTGYMVKEKEDGDEFLVVEAEQINRGGG